MSRNTYPPVIELRERRKDRPGQLLGDVGVHVIAGVVGRLDCVDVEARSGAEVVGVVFTLDVQATFFSRQFISYAFAWLVGTDGDGNGTYEDSYPDTKPQYRAYSPHAGRSPSRSNCRPCR